MVKEFLSFKRGDQLANFFSFFGGGGINQPPIIFSQPLAPYVKVLNYCII